MKRDPVCDVCRWEPDEPDVDLDICPKCEQVVCSFCITKHDLIPHEQAILEFDYGNTITTGDGSSTQG